MASEGDVRNTRRAYAGLAILVVGGSLFVAFIVWPLGLYGDRLVWSLVLAAIALLLAHWNLALGPGSGRPLEMTAVVMGFVAFGPGAGSLAGGAAAAYRGWRTSGWLAAALGAAAAVIGVAVLFAVYAIAAGELVFADQVGAVMAQGGGPASVRMVTGLVLGGLAYGAVADVLRPFGAPHAEGRASGLGGWVASNLALSVVSAALALSYTALGTASIVMLGPIGALAWAIVVAFRVKRGSEYVSIYHKLTSIVVGGLTTALVLALGATGVFFYRDYTRIAIDRYAALAEGLTPTFVQAVAEGGTAARPTISIQIRGLFEDDPGLAYALVTLRGRSDVVISHVKPHAEDFIAEAIEDISRIATPGRQKIVWRSADTQLSVENVAVPIQNDEGDRLGMVHVGVDRALLNSRLRQLALTMALILAVALSISILTLRRFGRRSIVEPLRRITAVVQALSKGDADLRERIDESLMAHDELRQLSHSFNQFMANLQRLVTTASQTSRDVAVSAEQVAVSTRDLNASAEAVAGSMNGVMERLEREEQQLTEIDSLASRLAKAATAAAGSAERSAIEGQAVHLIAAQSRNKVEAAVNALMEVRDVVESSRRVNAELVATTRQVSGLVRNVAAIAEQTDFLALSASIEAARAGEDAHGFSVIAEEIRKLAEQSTSASQRAGRTIRAVELRVGEAVSTMNLALDKVSGVEDVSRSARGSLAEIVEYLEGQGQTIERIAAQMQEESRRAVQMQELITDVTRFSESNVTTASDVTKATRRQTASTHEIAAGTRELTDAAERLQGLIERFRV